MPTPYFDALERFVEENVLAFAMPGHQQGRGASPRFRDFLTRHGLAGDITQVQGMDDIQRPVSVCKRAQELAAVAYGADHSYFLVNGSSAGNQAMLLACLRPGQTVLVPRNAHRSVLSGLILAGARAAYYEPEYDAEMGVHHGPSPQIVEAALEAYPEARALLISSPTYYGAAADLRTLVQLAHDSDRLVLVDEAWGPHLAFHPELPVSAVAAGADLVVQSTHKLLAGMSQASMLHLRGTRVDRGRLEAVLRMLQTTSASTLLLASLDEARDQMVQHGRSLLTEALALADLARAGINAIPGLCCFGQRFFAWDPTRLVISARARGQTGYQVEEHLRGGHKLELELASQANVVALITLGHTREHIRRLLAGLADLPSAEPLPLPRSQSRPFLCQSELTPREAFDADCEDVPLAQAVGRVGAELIAIYPPGIPILCLGEVISAEWIEYVRVELQAGANIQGALDPTLQTVRVVSLCR